ncbi:MAG: SMC family ATPase [Gemmatimonadetes bacterium]|nr:SMC family ATPase [Gemmatimonadota bacterium]
MQLHRLKLANFRQHPDTEFILGPGLTAIIGPNGAGKTTLLEAIAWAFYGNPAARGKKESIRWNRAPGRSQVKVAVSFSLGAHEYTVERTLYGAELFQDGGSAPVTAGTVEVTGHLTRLFGMTHDEFFNTYFTSQKELAVMAGLGGAERGRFLSRVLGYEKLRVAQEAARTARANLKSELAGLERGLGDVAELERERDEAVRRTTEARGLVEQAMAAKQAAREALEREGPAWTRMVELRQAWTSLDGDRRIAEHQVVDAQREFERLDKELSEARNAQASLKSLEPALAAVGPLREELERLEVQSRAAGERRRLMGQHQEMQAQIARVGKRLGDVADAETTLRSAETTLHQARGELKTATEGEEKARTAWVRDKQDAQTKLSNHGDQYRDIAEQRERVVKAGPDGLCPTCGRPLGKDYRKMVEMLDRQIEEVVINGRYFRQRVEQLAAEPAGVRAAADRRSRGAKQVDDATQAVAQAGARVRERQQVERERKDLEQRAGDLAFQIERLPEKYDEARHDQLRDRLRELEPTIKEAERLKVRAERAAALVEEAEGAERRLSELEQRAKDLAAALADLRYSEEAYVQARARYEAADKAADHAELELVSARGELKAAEAARDGALRRLQERAERARRIEELKSEIRLHEELDAALADLRTDLIAQMRPELSDVASSLIADLTDGRYTELELDEDYELLLLADGLPQPVISGGEQDVANLVLRIAISQLVADRAGQPLSLLVLDEIFGSLDEARRESVVAVLRGLADRFPQVVLITHIESVRERVDRVLRVSLDRERGAAVVREDEGVAEGLPAVGVSQ